MGNAKNEVKVKDLDVIVQVKSVCCHLVIGKDVHVASVVIDVKTVIVKVNILLKWLMSR
jgi:hypothetical protein